MRLPHCVPRRAPNEIDYGKIMLEQIHLQLYQPEQTHLHGDIRRH